MIDVSDKLGMQDMALVLGVSEFTLKTLVQHGDVPYERNAGQVHFVVTQVLSHFRKQEGAAL